MDERKATARCTECGAEYEYDLTPYLDAEGQIMPHGHVCRSCVMKHVEEGRRIVREMVMNPDNEYEKRWAGGGPLVQGFVELAKALFGPTVRN